MSPRIDLLNQKFGRLTVIEFSHVSKAQVAFWKCVCDCGNTHVTSSSTLLHAAEPSCGCVRTENVRKAVGTHGMSKTREYHIWKGILARCYNKNNPAYDLYGGRGIKIYDAWRHDFSAFIAYIGKAPFPNMSIDRIDTNGNYEPGNVRWATQKTQTNNKNGNKLLTYKGEQKTLAQWAEHLGLHYRTLQDRLVEGWSIERAFETPTLKYQPNTIFIEYDGQKKTIKEWALIIGISWQAIYWRYKKNSDPQFVLRELHNQ